MTVDYDHVIGQRVFVFQRFMTDLADLFRRFYVHGFKVSARVALTNVVLLTEEAPPWTTTVTGQLYKMLFNKS